MYQFYVLYDPVNQYSLPGNLESTLQANDNAMVNDFTASLAAMNAEVIAQTVASQNAPTPPPPAVGSKTFFRLVADWGYSGDGDYRPDWIEFSSGDTDPFNPFSNGGTVVDGTYDDYDGDGIMDKDDAVVSDALINWQAAAESSYFFLPLDEVPASAYADPHEDGPFMVGDDGTVVFADGVWRGRTWYALQKDNGSAGLTGCEAFAIDSDGIILGEGALDVDGDGFVDTSVIVKWSNESAAPEAISDGAKYPVGLTYLGAGSPPLAFSVSHRETSPANVLNENGQFISDTQEFDPATGLFVNSFGREIWTLGGTRTAAPAWASNILNDGSIHGTDWDSSPGGVKVQTGGTIKEFAQKEFGVVSKLSGGTLAFSEQNGIATHLQDSGSAWGQSGFLTETLKLNSEGVGIVPDGRLWRNGEYHYFEDLCPGMEEQGYSDPSFLDINDSGVVLIQAKEGGENKPALAFELQVIIPERNPAGILTGELEEAKKLAFGKMEDALNATGVLDIDQDPDRFYVRLRGAAELDNVFVQVETTENPNAADYDDGPTKISVEVDGEDLITESLLLVSDKTDDEYVGNGVGADDQDSGNDRTHRAQIEGKFKISKIFVGSHEYEAQKILPIPAKYDLKGRIILMGDALDSVLDFNEYRDVAKERYAQVGIKFSFTTTSLPMPAGVDPDNVEWEDGGWSPPESTETFLTAHPDIVAMVDAAIAAEKMDTITIFVVPDLAGSIRGRALRATLFAPHHQQYSNIAVISEATVVNENALFTIAHEPGHILMDDGHYGEDYGGTPPQHKVNHNLMRGTGTSDSKGIDKSKRLYEMQEGKFLKKLLTPIAP